MSGPDWSAYPDPCEGVRINDDGYYECKSCDEIVEATGEAVRDGGRTRGKWHCPECDSYYHI